MNLDKGFSENFSLFLPACAWQLHIPRFPPAARHLHLRSLQFPIGKWKVIFPGACFSILAESLASDPSLLSISGQFSRIILALFKVFLRAKPPRVGKRSNPGTSQINKLGIGDVHLNWVLNYSIDDLPFSVLDGESATDMMAARAGTAARHGIVAALSNSRSTAKRSNLKHPGKSQEPVEFINAASRTVQGDIDGASLLGVMPDESECIMYEVVMKLNHELEWSPRQLALTSSNLCFSFEGENCMRDNILLHEVK